MAVNSYTPTKNYPSFSSVINETFPVVTKTTAGAVTYTAAEIISGLILRDTNGASRSDVTPSAADLLAAVEGAQVNSGFKFHIRNTADAAETITMTAGTGITISGTATIAQNNGKNFLAVFTNVTSGSEAVTIYSLGTVVF